MFYFNKRYFQVILAGIIIMVPLLFSSCVASASRSSNESAESVVKHNIEILCSEGYSEDEINRLMEILKQLNQPVSLGTEKITETGTHIQKTANTNYSEEYLWFLTNAEEKYYVFIQKNSSIIYFVCKGDLEGGEYIYRTYQ